MPKWKVIRQKATLVIIIVTVVVATVDVFSDWWLFKDFCLYGGGKLTAPLGIFCVVSSVLFALEVRNFIWSLRMYRKSGPEVLDGVYMPPTNATPEQKRLERWQETVSFLLLAFEDFPVTVIMYVAFKQGPCEIFTRVFEESFTGNLALLAAFFSSLWKGLLSFCYCCNVCRCKYHDIHGPCNYFGCCCCRFFRPIIAICLMGFAAYLYFEFNNKGASVRPECFDDYVLTTISSVTENS